MDAAFCLEQYNRAMFSRMAEYREARRRDAAGDFRAGVFDVCQNMLASGRGHAPDLMAEFQVTTDDLVEFLMAHRRRL